MSPEDEWTISTTRGERLTEDTSLVARLPLLLQHPVHALHLMRHELHIETVNLVFEPRKIEAFQCRVDVCVFVEVIQSGLEQSRDAVISQKSRFKAHPSEVVGLSTS